MDTITQIQVAWELHRAGQKVEAIAAQLGKHRATIYRWFKGIRMRGVRGYVAYFKGAKQGRRVRKTHGYVVQRILGLRREYRECCGEKIVYLLAQEGVRVSRSTVYRILNRHRVLRKHHRQPKGGPVQQATGPRQVVQVDTVDLGALYAYTAIDTFTREAAIVVRPSLQAADGRRALATLMQSFGHVQLIQTDGGSEFKAECAEGMHRWANRHRIARAYKKNEQAFIEAFNGTLRREALGYPKYRADQLAAAQQAVDEFLTYYHQRRPHLSLNMLTPARFAESHLL
jgi:transposase InsO family protein